MSNKSGSVRFGEGQPASIKKANAVSYATKAISDTDERSHGSRPSHVNKPAKKPMKA